MPFRFPSIAAWRAVPWVWLSLVGVSLAAAAALAVYAARTGVASGMGVLGLVVAEVPSRSITIPRPLVQLSAAEVLLGCVVTGVIAWRAPRSSTARSLTGFLAAVTLVWALLWFGIPVNPAVGFSLSRKLGPAFVLVPMVAAGAAFVGFTSRFPRALTDADVLLGSPHGRVRRAIDRVVIWLGPVLAPLRRWRERTRRAFTPPVDSALLAAALASLALNVLALDSFADDALTAERIRANLALSAHAVAFATWTALLGVVAGAPIRRWARNRLPGIRIPLTALAVAIATVSSAALAVTGTIQWLEALTLASAAVLAARTAAADRDAAGRRFDWWLTLSALATGVGEYYRGQGMPALMATLTMVSFVFAPLRLVQHSVRTATGGIERRLRRSPIEQPPGESPPAPDGRQLGTRQLLRCLLLRPAFLWGLVLLTAGGLAVAQRLPVLPSFVGVTSFVVWLVTSLLSVLVPLMLAVGLMVRGATQLRLGYALSDAVTRRKSLWLVVGLNGVIALFVIGQLAPLVPNLPAGFLDAVRRGALLTLFPVTVLSVATVVFYHGALDPRLLLRATSLYALLGIVGVFAYAGIENLVEDGVTMWLGLPKAASPWVTGGVVTLTVGSLRERLSAVIASAVARAFPEVVLDDGAEVAAVVAAVDVADDHATDPSAIRLTLRRAALLQAAARHAARRYGGRVATANRDMLVVEFQDASGALDGVAAIGAEYERRCARGSVPLVKLRIGLHMGPALRADGGALFGPVVDIADDLRRCASPGAILLTEAVVDAAGAIGAATPWGELNAPSGGGVLPAFQLTQSRLPSPE